MPEDKTDVGPQETAKPLEERINETLATADENGKIAFSEDVDPVFKKLVLTEKRARQYQAKTTKTTKELASLKAAREVLEKSITQNVQLSAEQQAELDELKFTDPDEWFKKKVQYENEVKQATTGKLQEQIEEASKKALDELTLSERKEVMASFTSQTGIELTDEVMENDIPPRLQKKMTEMPFEDYLNEVASYLGKGKKIKDTDESLDQPDLGKMAGSSATTKQQKSKYVII